MKKVYVFGSLNMDLVITSPREVLIGETIHGSGFMTNPGGKGANQAAACAKLGGETLMGGCVGNDDFGARLTKQLSSYGADVSRVRAIDGVPTGVAVIVVTDGDNRIILDSGANGQAAFYDADALLSDAQPGDIFLTQLENPIPVVGYALRKAKEKGLVTILNPAPMNPEIKEYLPYVDIVTPNEGEFVTLAGTENICAGAELLASLGIGCTVVTMGSRGYCCCTGEKTICEDSIKCTPVDTTAAGDTFTGALAARLACGDDLEQALHFANRAAAITVTRPGAQQSIPTLDELK